MLRLAKIGKEYPDGAVIVRQGEPGDCMYVVQGGRVEVLLEHAGRETVLAELGAGEFFGEMSLFTGAPRSATVRAKGRARVLTIDKRMFLKRIHTDPSLAFRMLAKQSIRLQTLNSEITRLRDRLDGPKDR